MLNKQTNKQNYVFILPSVGVKKTDPLGKMVSFNGAMAPK